MPLPLAVFEINWSAMNILEIVRQTITTFCVEFVSHPYLCYTEHGQHALFYTKLYSALPEELRYATWQQQKVCILQKEYPTAANLGKSQRQHWDVAVLSVPPTSRAIGAKTYDYLKLLAAIEFGMNEAKKHLVDDIERLDHADANVVQGFIVHLYRLSNAKLRFSGRDWSHNAACILTPEQVGDLSLGRSVEIYYGMADGTGNYESEAWHIKSGQMSKIK
jgi:hypothetical protein